MKRRTTSYSIAWLLICMTVIAACLGVVVSPNMWTTAAVSAVRLLLCASAMIVVLNERRRAARVPVAFLAANIAYAIVHPWHYDSEIVHWLMQLLDRIAGESAMIGLWHIWSLLCTAIVTLLISVFLKPQPLDWRVD